MPLPRQETSDCLSLYSPDLSDPTIPSTTDSLNEFFENYAMPIVYRPAGKTPGYLTSLNYWARATGDPPLCQIDQFMMAKFVSYLRESCPRIKSSNTVRKHCRQLASLLKLAGPCSASNPQGIGLLSQIPFFPTPSPCHKPPVDNFTVAEISDMVSAARLMDGPASWVGQRYTPRVFWESLLLLAYNTGLRIGSLMAMEWGWISFARRSSGAWGTIRVPAGSYKGGAGRAFPLNQPAYDVLLGLQTKCDPSLTELVFPWLRNGRPCWPGSKRLLYIHFKTLLGLASIPADRWFGFHGIRKCFVSEMAAINPLAAQLGAGHSTMKTTVDHYVNPDIISGAAKQLPQPKRSDSGQLYFSF